ncbi:MAG: Ig-like domain-containing protein [Methylococcaceae bacterium]
MNFKYHHVSLLLAAFIIIPTTLISSAIAGAPSPGITTIITPVEAGTDDAEENTSSGDMSLSSSDLELIQDGTKEQKVGLRFKLDIPPGATITEASIQFTTDEKTSEATTLTVYGQASINALTFSNTDFDISNRTLTTAFAPWTPAPWVTATGEAGLDQETPDLSSIVQETVNQAGWTEGNAIVFIISGNGKRVAESFNGSAPAELHVSFSTEPAANQTPDAVDDGSLATPTYTTDVNQQLIVANGIDDIVERNDNVGIPAAEVSSFDTTSAEGGSVTVAPNGSFTYTPAEDFAGIDSFSYTLGNSEGTDSATVYIEIQEPLVVTEITTLWIPVAIGSDDAEQRLSSGRVSLSSSDLELIRDGSSDQLVGVRFQQLDVPKGATITNAYIQYTADENTTEETTLTIFGEATSNALTFSSTAYNISDRTLTSVEVQWAPAAWNTNEQDSSTQATPDLSAIVQEIVNQSNWAQGNAIAFITSGSGKRVAESFNGTAAPVLHVSFSTESPVLPTLDAPDATDDFYSTDFNQQLTVTNGPNDIVESNDYLGTPIANLVTFGESTGQEYTMGSLGMTVNGGEVTVNSDGSFSYAPPTEFSGNDSFSYILLNSEGQSQATVTIEVLEDSGVVGPVPPTILTVPVSAGSDDAEQDSISGDMDLGSSDLELTLDRSSNQLIGIRFQGIEVPAGAIIESTHIQFTTDETSSEPANLTISGEASVNSLTFNNTDFDISNRTLTTSSVGWDPLAWNTRGVADQDQRTLDLSVIVQEIVDQTDWTQGNAISFIISGNGNRVAESYNGTAAPVLYLSFSDPSTAPANNAPTVTDLSVTAENGTPISIGDILTGTYTYNDTENDPQGSSTFRWLRNGSEIPGATEQSYTTVAADSGSTLTFEITPSATRGTSPGIAAISASVLIESLATNVTISGNITYDRVPLGPKGTGLNYEAIISKPVRKTIIEMLNASDTILATTTTDNNGDYAFSVSSNTDVKIRIKAEILKTGTPSWNVPVVDNTTSNALYVLDGALTSSGSANSTRNLHAASGWGGSGYTSTRNAAPFAILDSVLKAIELVLTADGNATFPKLTINWSVNNVPASGNKATGQIGTSHYTSDNIFLLGKENTDIEEYDEHVIIHEWAHYYEDNFSRSDSIGGAHRGGERLDMRLAFGEGFATAFSGMVTNIPIYRDSFGSNQQNDFEIKFETATHSNAGWYSESSVQRILYDLFDATNEGAHDTLVMGFGPIHNVMIDKEKNAPAFTSIFTFISALKAENPTESTAIDTLLGDELIQPIQDVFGTGETNNGGNATDVLPIYTQLTVDAPAINRCIIKDFGSVNNLSNHRFFRFSITTPGNYTISIVRTGSEPIATDPDFKVYQTSDFTRAMDGFSGIENQETSSAALATGDYIMDMNEFNDVAADTCLDVTLASAS